MKKWKKFLGGLAVLSLVYILIPVLHQLLPGSRMLRDKVEAENIDVSALFYSEEIHTSTAQQVVEEKLKTSRPAKE